MEIVEFNKLTKAYKKNRGIIDLSFSINEGEIFGFIGPNGAGKSTTIRTLLNLLFPTSGKAAVFGMDIEKKSKEIRKNIGYLPSEVHYYDDMKAADLLRYSGKFYKNFNEQRMTELAKKLNLDLNRKIEDLSFGNKKKVGIIQALLHEPKLIILDEPTSGLDPLMQNTFFELLLEEKRKGATIFFSSHILSEVQKVCDRVAIIKDGRIVKVETVENLTKNNVKHITLIFKKDRLSDINLEGVYNKNIKGNETTFLFNGDLRSLLAMLPNLELNDIRIEEPSLEDVFMHFYEK